jgi:hypothetical protein
VLWGFFISNRLQKSSGIWLSQLDGMVTSPSFFTGVLKEAGSGSTGGS